jgi:hypothetical protein
MKLLALSLLAAALSACPTPTVTPLVGEDPEVVRLLGRPPDDDPASSPLGAARRLHQALVQQDTEMTWSLLSTTTRKALDERGAAIATSGRELLDDSTLPAPNGAVRKVRYETIFFGVDLVDLEDTSGKIGDGTAGETRPISAVSRDGTRTQLDFVREADGWKLQRTSF